MSVTAEDVARGAITAETLTRVPVPLTYREIERLVIGLNHIRNDMRAGLTAEHYAGDAEQHAYFHDEIRACDELEKRLLSAS